MRQHTCLRNASLNTDGLTYIEMGEGIREADWGRL